MSWLRNAWYMAAWSHELGATMLRRKLLDKPVLFFRKMGGTRAQRLLQQLQQRESAQS